MKNLFEKLISESLANVENVVEADKKAEIFANLANAVAVYLSGNKDEEAAPTKKGKKSNKDKGIESVEKGSAKGEKEEKNKKEQVEEKETQVEEQNEAAPEAPETTEADEDTWTEEKAQEKAESLEILQTYVDAWGEDYVYGDCVYYFTEQAFRGQEFITPSNIDGFVNYLNFIRESNEEGQEQ